ncbi:hypothetical protein M9H77_22262 [Catharanthus roseus]|uniref:Uncharacterized protein n=1 Tax=Catharanthus roseus TaxID=4058 RepID=A0ACC0AS19_CATRO|nr:hypothetical protein M9H77_22262 [Catharanthus roseus]
MVGSLVMIVLFCFTMLETEKGLIVLWTFDRSCLRMEEDKKKKKNKKKKNKQNKAAESSGNGAGEHINWDQNHVNQTDHKNTGEVHGTTDAQNDVIVMRDGNQLRHVANGPEVASLEEKIKQLQEEREADIQKQVILEERIQQLQKEQDAFLTEKANVLEQIKQLQGEKVAYSLKEASLEHQISELEKEKDSCAQKESHLEEKVARLESENEAHMQKQIQFEAKINHLVDEVSTLSLEKNSNKEIIAILNVDNSRLHAQVLQLEQSRNSLLEENQHLRETISVVQYQMLNFDGNAASSRSSVEGKMVGFM